VPADESVNSLSYEELNEIGICNAKITYSYVKLGCKLLLFSAKTDKVASAPTHSDLMLLDVIEGTHIGLAHIMQD